MSYSIVKHRRGTTQEWLDIDLIPEDGELVIEECQDNICKCKIGNGKDSFTKLPYLSADIEARLIKMIESAKASFDSRLLSLDSSFKYNIAKAITNLEKDIEPKFENITTLVTETEQQIQETIENLQEELSQLESRLVGKALLDKQELTDAIQETRKQLTYLHRTEFVSLLQRVDVLEGSIDDLLAFNAEELKNELSDHVETIIGPIEADLANIKTKLESTSNEAVEALKEDIKALSADIETRFYKHNTEQKNQLDKIHETLTGISTEIENLSDKLNSDKEELVNSLNDLSANMITRDATVTQNFNESLSALKQDNTTALNNAVFKIGNDISKVVADYEQALVELKDLLLKEHSVASAKITNLENSDSEINELINTINDQLAELGKVSKNLADADKVINSAITSLDIRVATELGSIKTDLSQNYLDHLKRHIQLLQTVNNLSDSQQLLYDDATTLLHTYINAIYTELSKCASNDFFITHKLIEIGETLSKTIDDNYTELSDSILNTNEDTKSELQLLIASKVAELTQADAVLTTSLEQERTRLDNAIAGVNATIATSIYNARNEILGEVSKNNKNALDLIADEILNFKATLANNVATLRSETDAAVSPLINLFKNLKSTTDTEFARLNKLVEELECDAIADNVFLVNSIARLDRAIETNRQLLEIKGTALDSKIAAFYDETARLSADIECQANRISSIITPNKDKTPIGDEIEDIRSGYDGKSYTLAGDAVRAIGKDLNNLRSSLSDYINTQAIDGLYYDYNGDVGLMQPYMLYLMSGDQILEDSGIKIISGAAGGGGGGSGSSSLKLGYITNSPVVVTPNDKAIIKFSFSGTDSSGDVISQAAATWKVNGVIVEYGTVLDGENEFDVSKYLTPGTTTNVLLVVTDDNGSVVTKNWKVQQLELFIRSSFNSKITYPAGEELLFSYEPNGAVDKTAVFLLDNKELGRIAIGADVSGTEIKYRIPPQTHGSHLLEFYLEADVNGVTITSAHEFKDLLFFNTANSRPVLGTEWPSTKIMQYSSTNIVYTVYDAATETPTVTIKVDNKEVSTVTLKANTEYNNTPTGVFSYLGTEVGKHTIQIICKDAVKTITIDVEDIGISVAPVTDGLVFDFNPIGLSNDDIEKRLWSYNNIHLTVSDNFDWTNGGYVSDGQDPAFCIKAGSRAYIDYKLFEDDAKKFGKEFKLIFKTKNVANSDTKFLTCLNQNIGLDMGAHTAYIYGRNGVLDLAYSEEDIIEFEFNITKNTDLVPMVMGYEDGVPSRPMVYDDSYSFKQDNPQIITIGSDECDTYIYRLKAYNTSLTNTDILNNFIADARSADEMITRYNRNQIYNENHKLTPESLAEKCPWLRVYKLSAPKFTNNKSEKIKNTTIQQIYKNGDPVLDNWICYKAQHSGQGTSSNNYGAAGRNLDFIMNKGDAYFELGDGSTADTITLTRESVPVAYLNAKVNIASSNNLTNAMLANRYNKFNPYRRPFVARDGINLDFIKDTMEFYNCVIFIQETDPDMSTHREFADTDWHFYAIGNIGDSKKTDNTRTTDPNDKYECCVEIMDVGLPLSDFPEDTMINAMANTVNETTGERVYKWAKNENLDILYELVEGKYVKTSDTSVDLTKTYYVDILEHDDFSEDYTYGWRYITDEEDSDVINTCKKAWIDFYRFVTTSSDEDFKNNLSKYFVVDSALYYYLFTTRYCMVDNRAKNTFWHYGKSPDGTRKWDLCWDYDNDTSLGLNNYGKQVYRYGLEDIDKDDSGTEVFRESDSTFFCRIRDLFAPELKAMYKELESENAWHAESFINSCDAWQEEFPEELWRLDIERKYLRTYTSSFVNGKGDAQFLTNMCNGRMKYHRRQWERNQEQYMASKYQTTRASGDDYHVNMRVNRFDSTDDLTIKPNYQFTLTPYSHIYLNVWYGDVSRTPFSIRANPNEPTVVPCPAALDADIINIGNAAALKDLGDLSICYPQTVSVGNASRIKKLTLGNDSTTYDNANFTTLTTGANPLLEEINVENISSLNQSLNLTQLTNLKKLYAYGTSISGVLFAPGGKIQEAELPAVTNITLKRLRYLTDANLKLSSYDSVVDLIVEDCPGIDQKALLDKCVNVTKVRLSNINFGRTTYDEFSNKIFPLKGETSTGDDTQYAILEGTVTFEALTGEQYNLITKRYPLLDVFYDSLISTVTFKDIDNTAVLKTIECTAYNSSTTDCINPVYYGDQENIPEGFLAKPILPPSENGEFRYDFLGWSDKPNIIVSEEDNIPLTPEARRRFKEDYVKAVAGDRVLYPVFESIRRSYTVTFYNKTNTGKQVVEIISVPYGSKAICSHEDAIKKLDTTSPDLFTFTGWLPDPVRVTGTMECYAQFAVDEGDWHELDLLDISNCPVYGGGTKDGYTLVDNNIYITEYNNGLNVAVKVPETITIGESTYNVVKLTGFSGDTTLELISLPKSLKELSTDCFSRCTRLLEIKLPDSLETLASGALYNCTKLVKISIPASVKLIEDSALAACSAVTELQVHPDNERYYVKNNCLIDRTTKKLIQGLSNGFIPVPAEGEEPEVTTLGAYCFSGMNITSFEVPDTIGSIVDNNPTGVIAKNAFSNCKELESIILPDTIKTLDATSFAWDNKLKTVRFPNKLETIGTYVFYQTALTDITLPATVKNIYENAFGGITTLHKVTFNAMPTEVNSKAFVGSGAVEFYMPWTREAHEKAFQGTYTVGAISYAKDICFGANIGSTLHFSDGEVYRKTIFLTTSFDEMEKEA